MTTISSADFRDRLSNILNRAHFAHERIVITKHGDPVAAVVSIEDLKAIEALERRSDIKAALAYAARQADHAAVLEALRRG
jgi:prevent-host-death family protein